MGTYSLIWRLRRENIPFRNERNVRTTLHPMTHTDHHIHAIVFDFGGVLLDWNPRHLYLKLFDGDAQGTERFLSEIGFTDWNLEMDRGHSFADGVAELSRQFPQYADLIQAYDLRWEESILGPIQTTVNILRNLKQAGYSIYGLTNFSEEKYRLVRSMYPFLDQLDDVIVSGEVKLIKPDPRIYHLLLERIQCAAAECVIIDDSEENADMARRLGFHSIQYKSSGQLQEELKQLGLLSQHPL
jgi:2-haloacid dehalogenase